MPATKRAQSNSVTIVAIATTIVFPVFIIFLYNFADLHLYVYNCEYLYAAYKVSTRAF